MAKRDGKISSVENEAVMHEQDAAPIGEVQLTATAQATATTAPAPRVSLKPIHQLIDEFWVAINNHPDVKMLTCALGGRPERNTTFPTTPISEQHKMEIRFVYRESHQEVAKKAAQPGAYEPGGKFFHLLPQKGEETAPEIPNGAKRSWEHLLPEKRKQPELVEAGA